MELEDPWTASAVKFAPPRAAARNVFKVPFGAFLALVVALGVVTSYVVLALPLYLSVQSGNAGLAREVQNLTSANVFGQMGTTALIPLENLAVLSLALGAEARVDRSAISPASVALQRRLLVHTVTTFGGVFLGTLDGTIVGYYATPTGLQFVNSSSSDSRQQDWFVGATRDNHTEWRSPGRVFWTHVQVLPGCNCLGITGSRPVYVGSELVAVVATHLPIVSISSQGLNRSKIGMSGVAILIDHNGTITGVSDPARFNFSFANLTNVRDVPGTFMADLVRFFNGNFSNIAQFYRDNVVLDGKRSLLLTQHVAIAASLNWTGVVIFPWDDYFGATDAALTRSLIVGAATTVALCGAMIALAALLLTCPLRQLADRMEDVVHSLSNAQSSSSSSSPQRRASIISEVHVMETSYAHMLAGLQGFGKYVPVPVVMDLVHSGQEPQAGVQVRTCSFLFSDIVSFTTLAEAVPAEQLHRQLSEYFDAMEEILHDLRGITTDYLGDGLFVFWNAPTLETDHALLACEAALRQQSRLVSLRTEWIARGLPPMFARIGVNTGSCLVGSFGSKRHLKYTAMGDAVNTASRLESLNKHYGTSIIIGEATYALVSHRYLARAIDNVVVMGRTTPLRVYELLCDVRVASQTQRTLVQLSESLLDAFAAKDFVAMQNVARAILEIAPGDVPTLLLLERCHGGSDMWESAPRIATEK